MSSEIKVPTLPESIADATVVTWHKQPGDSITRDEVIVEVETDKVVLEVPAAEDGVLGEIIEQEGAVVNAHQVIGTIEPAGSGGGDTDSGSDGAEDSATDDDGADDSATDDSGQGDGAAEKRTREEDAGVEADGAVTADDAGEGETGGQTSPVVRALLEEHGLSADDVKGSGKNGRISKEDVEKHVASSRSEQSGGSKSSAGSSSSQPAKSAGADSVPMPGGDRGEKRVPMTRLRKRIAERLMEATQSTAMLTTFNEVNMQGFIDLRNQYKDLFEKTHDVKLGFMSIFVKAATEALKRFPDVNASIDGDDVVYHGFCDVGVAVSSDRGLVVPVLRNTETLSLAAIEKEIGNYAGKAREGKLTIEEMTGGTFTVSNGGVFGSLLSTPILNPPQSAILGMHATQQRPIAENGQVVIRPMMYIALSYDHRIVDGKGAVTFLKTIKELVEDPARIVFEL